VDVLLRVTFSVPVDPATLPAAVLRAGIDVIDGVSSLEGNENILVFDPTAPLAYARTYTFDFSGLRDVFGRSFEELPPILFTTRPAERPFGDMDGDYERDLADVDLGLLLLLGLRDPADEPMSRIDLNATAGTTWRTSCSSRKFSWRRRSS
jgi:hypothetical protein